MINRSQKKKEIKYKSTCNFLELVDFKTKLESIDNLLDFDNNLEPLINMSYQFQEEYKQKIILIKNNLIYLNELNSKYNIFQSIKISKQISNDLESIVHSLNEHDEKIKLSKKLYENISNILIDYVEVTNEIMFFFEKNIMRKYDNSFIAVRFQSLRENLSDLNELKKNFNLVDFFSIVSELNSLLQEITSLLRVWYIADKVCSYIQSNIKEIEKNLISGIKTIRNKDNNYVEKNLSILKNRYKNITNELKFSSFDDIHGDISDCLIVIQNIQSKIEYTLKNDIFYSEYLEVISNWLFKIKSEENVIKSTLNDIFNNLNNKELSTKQIRYIYTLTDELIKRWKIIKYDIKTSELTAEKYIDFIIKTINLLYSWVISLDSLIKRLEDKYLNFSFSIKEISNFKFLIAKIVGSIHEYNISDKSIIDKSSNIFYSIEKIEKEISKNYKSVFRNDISEWLTDSRLNLIESKSYVEKEIKLKFYAEKLLIYANKFLIKIPLFENKIKLAEEYYLNKNYKRSIDFLLKEIKKIR